MRDRVPDWVAQSDSENFPSPLEGEYPVDSAGAYFHVCNYY